MSARLREHAPQNVMTELDEIVAFYDGCSALMRALLDGLAERPDEPRVFPEIEDALGWPHRRIASVLGGAYQLRTMAFAGRRPYHFFDERTAASKRWELWMDATQAAAVREARTGARG